MPDDSTVQLHHELSSSSLDALTGQGVRQSVGGIRGLGDNKMIKINRLEIENVKSCVDELTEEA